MQKISLNGEWEFRQSSESTWKPAVVPGSVFTDLLRQDLIPDPFIGTNERAVQWVAEKDWEYRKTFTVPWEIFTETYIKLAF
jgi:beta-mannosidase